MTSATPPSVPELSVQIAGDVSTADEPANWTCYSAGAYTTEWVIRAAEDPSAPTNILGMLAESCNVEVRMAVADNRSASLETLMMLAQDESDDLRYQLAENHNIDKSVLNLLTEDSNPFVAHRAQKTLARLERSVASVVRPVLNVVTVVRRAS
jgi:hypothetical protein